MEKTQLGLNIKKFRESKGWSLSKLKAESGVGYATLHDIESGKSKNLNSSTIERVAKALNLTVDELLGVEVEILEVEVGELEETLEKILTSDELKIDGEDVTEEEKEELNYFFKMTLNNIRRRRKRRRDKNENNSNL